MFQVLVTVSVEVALGIVKLLCGETEEAFTHWSSAINVALTAKEYNVAVGLCRLLLPQGKHID